MNRIGRVEMACLVLVCCLVSGVAASRGEPADHLLITEICVTPTPAEFVEIYNPTDSPIDLTDYYLCDAIYSLDQDYINLVDCTYTPWSSDFLAQFPDGEIIAPGEALWMCIDADSAASYYPEIDPDFELHPDVVPDEVPNMIDPGIDYCQQIDPWIGTSAYMLSNGAEVMILYHWDGEGDLIRDVDIAQWGDISAQINVYKTGLAKDGPDPDTFSTFYLDDTPVGDQDYIASSGHSAGESWQRLGVDEGAEVLSGGNGVTGHDETSEDLSNTWIEAESTPGDFYAGAPILLTLYVGGEEDSSHITDHTPLISWAYDDPGSVPQAFYEVEVGTDDEWSVAEMWDPDSVASPDTFTTYAGASLEDGETYYARARASNGTDWSDWAETMFHMNAVPTAPALLSPPDGGQTLDLTPTLVVLNADDVEGDPLTYTFEVYSDSLLSGLVDSATEIAEGVDSTSWEVTETLTWGEEYWWRARADDGYEPGIWMATASFTVGEPGISEQPEEREVSTAFFLAQSLPNPMRSNTAISYGVPGDGRPVGAAGSGGRPGCSHVTLSIYNLAGQLVRRLVDAKEEPGIKRIVWDGRDGQGTMVSSGVYFYRLTVGEQDATRRLVVLK